MTKRVPLTNQIALGMWLQPALPARVDRHGRRWRPRRTQECWYCCLCSMPTVRNHASNILTKLMASTRRSRR